MLFNIILVLHKQFPYNYIPPYFTDPILLLYYNNLLIYHIILTYHTHFPYLCKLQRLLQLYSKLS